MLATLGYLAMGGCRHLAVEPELAVGWEALSWRGQGFAALFRLSCCGHRGLVATVQAGEAGVGLSVVAPPGTKVFEGWTDDAGTWLAEGGGHCLRQVPGQGVPLPSGAIIPVNHRLLAALLAGRLPRGGEPDDSGWVIGLEDGWVWRARVVGAPPRCVRFEAAREGEAAPKLAALLDRHRGSLPGRVVLVVDGARVEAVLEAFRATAEVMPPSWLAAPPCGGRS